MESKRQQKFAGVLQEELAQVFQREGAAFLPNTLVTITRVRVSPDLAVAKVYLSFFNTNNTTLSINTVNAHAGEIRYKLGSRIRHQVRVVPELTFFVDDTNEYVERMDHLFDKIAKEPRQKDEDSE
ncbi:MULTISPECIES: 30S ribosome-binding factor RbfA [Pedobacter]|jgi:ribosome-binding factor A|uniref:Ribosome-binding factor A n=2 Tax=Pedobacter TaxID=84567 RepID=A0A7G9QFH2_9SPHI|nr:MULTISPECIES: 30S ribosome-binding factor RbfA [Pedobacter]KQM75049.1 ribosome-binding factor A [Pedobacter sp. Leaf216]QDW27653.1 30S ribosome-binding factor RbfA [Pedobacter sp. KBS0701]QNN42097.1 30S ribosome-binding factor RbfA [Pedobacter roseus]RBQ06943.1 30S ribosome-binding factor RbfA [Pedobacter miscanthi]